MGLVCVCCPPTAGLGDLDESGYDTQLSNWNGTIIGPQNVRRANASTRQAGLQAGWLLIACSDRLLFCPLSLSRLPSAIESTV